MKFLKKENPTRQPAMFELLVVIVNRGKGEAVFNCLKNLHVGFNVISFGEGTAPSNLQHLFNYSQEKEVIFAVINLADHQTILDTIDQTFLLREKNSGIAFTIPLKSMTNGSLEMIKRSNQK